MKKPGTVLFLCSILLVSTTKAQTWIELNSNFSNQSEGVLDISVVDGESAISQIQAGTIDLGRNFFIETEGFCFCQIIAQGRDFC